MNVIAEAQKVRSSVISATLFAILMARSGKGNFVMDTFHRNPPMLGEVNGTIVSTFTEMRCAALCVNDEQCASFEFNKQDKTCEMSDGVISGPSKHAYIKSSKNACRSENGYRIWIYPDMTLCLKYTPMLISHQTIAVQMCKDGGGHLALIANQSMGENIADALLKQGASTTDKTYIDGFDIMENGVFVSWKGEPLDWTAWIPGNPHGGDEYCMVGTLGGNFHFIDAFCDWARNYLLCQIDI